MVQIVKYPDPILLLPAAPVTVFDEALAQTVDETFETMYVAGGVGLAAPQVNLSLRLFVVNVDVPAGDYAEVEDPAQRQALRATVRELEHHFINPEILELSGEQIGDEGCLSIPNVGGKVKRANYVRMRYQMVTGETREESFSGYAARAVQHEYDHIEGRLFLDYLSSAERTLAERHLKKLRAEHEARQKRARQRDARAKAKARKKVKR